MPSKLGARSPASRVERVTERTLAFTDRALFFVLSNSTENDLLAFIGELLGSQ